MHAAAWVAWVLMVMTVALMTTNPLYLCLLLLSVLAVAVFAPRSETAVVSFRVLLIGGSVLLAVSALIATINGGYGDHVLFTMPGPDLPSWLGGLRLGGPVTAENLVASTTRGLAILCVFLAFAVFHGAVSAHRVLRMGPAALFHAGLVLTVGLTLLPATIDDLRRLRELRALRGGSMGLRSVPALVVPAVIGGLERSMRLGEALEARGYAAPPPLPVRARIAGVAAAPLALVAGWVWLYAPGKGPLALALAALSVAALGWWGFETSRARRTTRMRPEILTAFDAGSVVLSFGILATALVARSNGWFALAYNPFAGLEVPDVSAVGASLVLAALWPIPRLLFERPRGSERAAPALAVAKGSKL
jgi:energy-coupling factor transport system permease protein